MTSTVFSNGTVVQPDWLNDVNTTTYTTVPALTTSISAKADKGPLSASGITGAASAGPLGASGITGAAASGANSDITSLSGVVSINSGQLSGLRNRIINGNFGINQRMVSGTVTLSAGAYGHDRWKAGASGCTYTFATSQNVTTLTITAGTLQQVIEGINLDSGTFKLSWQGTATGRIDSGSYGASGVTGTAVGGTNQTIEFATGTLSKVQYEFGTVATVFEQRPYGLELALCQRYLPAIIASNTTGPIASGFSANTTLSTIIIPFQVPTRVRPTGVSVSSPSHFALNTAAALTTCSAVAFADASTQAAQIVVTNASVTAGQGCNLAFNSSSGLLLFTGCEL